MRRCVAIHAAGLGHNLDRRYRISTAHMTAVRFCRPLRDGSRLAATLLSLRHPLASRPSPKFTLCRTTGICLKARFIPCTYTNCKTSRLWYTIER